MATKPKHWAKRPVTRAFALSYPQIEWSPASCRERKIRSIQIDHARRSLAARKGWMRVRLKAARKLVAFIEAQPLLSRSFKKAA